MSRPRVATSLLSAALPAASLLYLVALTNIRGGLRDPAIGPFVVQEPWLIVAHVAAGIGLLLAGSMALVAGVSKGTGVAATLAGMAWFGPDLARLALWNGGPRGLGQASAVLVLPLLLLTLEVATRRAGTGNRLRAVAATVLIVALVVALAWVLAYAPFYDVRCTTSCNDLSAIVDPGSGGRAALRDATDLGALLAGAALVTVAIDRLRRGSREGGRAAVLIGGLVAGLAGVALASVGLLSSSLAMLPTGGGASDGTMMQLYATGAVGALLIALGVALLVLQVVRARQRIRQLAQGLAAAQEQRALATSLSGALGDAGLRVGYRSEVDAGYVDSVGETFDVRMAAGRSLTPIMRDGSTLGVVDHRDDIDPNTLAAELGPSILVAFDNERLGATQLAVLRGLQASRSRIVEVADAERRRIEHDLHDGAQQRLLAIAFDLRLGRLTAEQAGRVMAASSLADAERAALGIVDELRRICHGIHPQVLTQAGLGPALASLAEESTIAIDVRIGIDERPPAGVETAAYHVVTEAIEQAMRRGADGLTVDVAMDEGTLEVQAGDGGAEPLLVPLRLADRVGALGGEVIAGRSERGAFLRAVLPCA